MKEWYANNRGSHTERNRQWYVNNAEKHNERIMHQTRQDPAWGMHKRIKSRAKRRGIPFDLDPEDIVIPDVCPVLGIPIGIRDGSQRGDSASIDKIIPQLGYTKGNIIIISMLANRIKTNATPDQIITTGVFFKKLMQERGASDEQA